MDRLPLAVLLAMLSALTLPGCSPAAEAPELYLGGIQVNEPDLEHWLDALQAAGMNTVSVTDYAKQGDWDSANLWWEEEDGILAEVRAAKARDMRVVLILRVALDHAFERNRFLWHGMIMPRTDAELAEWFRRYTEFVLRWARIAEREGVDVLMIGSELNALTSTVALEELPPVEEFFLNEEKRERRKTETLAFEKDIEGHDLWQPGRRQETSLAEYLDERIAIERLWAEQVAGHGTETIARLNRRRQRLKQHWLELIPKVREVYRGKIGYAANFDQYHLVTFWNRLDVMGINSYFSLRDRLLPRGDGASLLPLLKEGWRDVLGKIQAFRAARGITEMPLFFTEIGYTYRANSTLEPWADTGYSLVKADDDADQEELIVWREQPVDLEERALAIRALAEVRRELGADYLRGLLYWKLSTVPSHRDIESFVIILGDGDPALAELRRIAG